MLCLDDAALYGELSLLIAGRVHPAILAVPMGTPVLALAYNPNFAGFFALVGREEHVVPVATAVRGDADELAARAERAWRAGPVDLNRIRAFEARVRRVRPQAPGLDVNALSVACSFQRGQTAARLGAERLRRLQEEDLDSTLGRKFRAVECRLGQGAALCAS